MDFDIRTTITWNDPLVREAMRKSLARVVGETTLDVQKKIHEKLSKKDNSAMMNPARSGQPPAMVTGALRNSWNVDMSNLHGDSPSALVISNLRYAKMLEYGSQELGKIVPKEKKFLTIPLNEEAGRLRRRTKNLRTVSGLFIIKEKGERTKKGKRKKGKKGKDYLVLAKTIGRGKMAKIKPMFLLVKSVYIKKHPYIRPVVDKLNEGRSRTKFSRLVGRYFIEYLKVGGLM